MMNVFNIADYGAVGDGKTLNTRIIQTQRGTGYIHHRPVQAIRIKREQDERDENQTAYERIEE